MKARSPSRRAPARRRKPAGAGALLSLHELAGWVCMPADWVEVLVEAEAIEPVRVDDEPWFAPAVVAEVRRMARLSRDLGIGPEAMGVVMDLLARIEALEAEIDRLRGR